MLMSCPPSTTVWNVFLLSALSHSTLSGSYTLSNPNNSSANHSSQQLHTIYYSPTCVSHVLFLNNPHDNITVPTRSRIPDLVKNLAEGCTYKKQAETTPRAA